MGRCGESIRLLNHDRSVPVLRRDHLAGVVVDNLNLVNDDGAGAVDARGSQAGCRRKLTPVDPGVHGRPAWYSPDFASLQLALRTEEIARRLPLSNRCCVLCPSHIRLAGARAPTFAARS